MYSEGGKPKGNSCADRAVRREIVDELSPTCFHRLNICLLDEIELSTMKCETLESMQIRGNLT
jgi:hypothetical protein